METLHQSPTDPVFVQDPYPVYDRARAMGDLVWWADYNMPCAFGHDVVNRLLRDRRLGREIPAERRTPVPDHLADFYALEDHSMLELEPPRHTRLRGLVLRAFTSRRIEALAPEIATLCHGLIDAFPPGGCNLLPAYAARVPVIVIARLLGVPDAMADRFLAWSNAMVAMYQARRTQKIEIAANSAARDFRDFMESHIANRRRSPADDLITHLIAAEEDGRHLSTDEMITTCILLLNAGHEATVHTMGKGIKALLETRIPDALASDAVAATVEEILRYDPPLHMFTRWVYEDVQLGDHVLRPGDQVGLMLGAAGRDPAVWPDPNRFDPARASRPNLAFGAGRHFCVGAPLARLELQIALPILFERLPALALAEPPAYADLYHFHGLERLDVTY